MHCLAKCTTNLEGLQGRLADVCLLRQSALQEKRDVLRNGGLVYRLAQIHERRRCLFAVLWLLSDDREQTLHSFRAWEGRVRDCRVCIMLVGAMSGHNRNTCIQRCGI